MDTNKLIQISYNFVLTKIQKLKNFKKKKKNFFLYRPVFPEIGRYEAGTAGIFSGTKQGGWVYRIAGRYGIFRPVWPVRYGIDIHGLSFTSRWRRNEISFLLFIEHTHLSLPCPKCTCFPTQLGFVDLRKWWIMPRLNNSMLLGSVHFFNCSKATIKIYWNYEENWWVLPTRLIIYHLTTYHRTIL